MSRKKVLITGANGLIGNLIYRHLSQNSEVYEVYGLARRRQHSNRLDDEQFLKIPDDRFILADISDCEEVQQSVLDMDVVVHMAADPGSGDWHSILANNVVGTYHVFEACRLAEVNRIIFASSGQVSFGYGVEEPYGAILQTRIDDIPDEIPVVTHKDPTRPMNLYASSKVWGEALAHTYAYRHGMSCICIRIGWVLGDDRPAVHHSKSDWCSHRDINQIVERSINAPESVRFDIFYGVSDNRYRWMDIEHPREVIGYIPQDRAEDYPSD